MKKLFSQSETVLFISHQWVSISHADPHGEQLQVLREGFRNLMSGEVEITPHWLDCFLYNAITMSPTRDERPWKDILRTAFIWYDYASIPQLSDGPTCNLNEQDTANAIASIANYVDRSDYLFILTPPLMEMEDGAGRFGHKDYNTWLKRGWCALELFSMVMKTGSTAKARTHRSIIRVIKFIINTIRNLKLLGSSDLLLLLLLRLLSMRFCV